MEKEPTRGCLSFSRKQNRLPGALKPTRGSLFLDKSLCRSPQLGSLTWCMGSCLKTRLVVPRPPEAELAPTGRLGLHLSPVRARLAKDQAPRSTLRATLRVTRFRVARSTLEIERYENRYWVGSLDFNLLVEIKRFFH